MSSDTMATALPAGAYNGRYNGRETGETRETRETILGYLHGKPGEDVPCAQVITALSQFDPEVIRLVLRKAVYRDPEHYWRTRRGIYRYVPAGGTPPSGTGPNPRAGSVPSRIIRLLESTGETLTPAEIRRMLPGPAVPAPTIHSALLRLARSGLVMHLSNGYSRASAVAVRAEPAQEPPEAKPDAMQVGYTMEAYPIIRRADGTHWVMVPFAAWPS